MEVKPSSVDNDSDGGLGNPSNGCWKEEFVNPVEYVPAVAESVLDEVVFGDLLCDAGVPSQDAGMRGSQPGSALQAPHGNMQEQEWRRT